jgi:hypothetical protein
MSTRLFAAFVLVLFLALGEAARAQDLAGKPDRGLDGIVFTDPGLNGVRDIHTTGNLGGLRYYNGDTLTATPAGAALQLWGNSSSVPGQAFLDSGAHDQAALIFRTAPGAGVVTERMRVAAGGNVGIGTTTPRETLTVAGTIESTTGGIKFPDGTVQKTAAVAAAATSGIISLSWNPGASGQLPYFVDITGSRVCAIRIADATTVDCFPISISTGAAVEPLNPNDANTNRMFVIGSGVGATQVCAVVGGGNNAATTRCTTY